MCRQRHYLTTIRVVNMQLSALLTRAPASGISTFMKEPILLLSLQEIDADSINYRHVTGRARTRSDYEYDAMRPYVTGRARTQTASTRPNYIHWFSVFAPDFNLFVIQFSSDSIDVLCTTSGLCAHTHRKFAAMCVL